MRIIPIIGQSFLTDNFNFVALQINRSYYTTGEKSTVVFLCPEGGRFHDSGRVMQPTKAVVALLKIVSIKVRVLCHKSTVILIELRRTFSMPENRLK